MIKYPWDQSRFMLDIDERSRSCWLDINHIIIYKYLQTHPVNSELFIFYFQTSFCLFWTETLIPAFREGSHDLAAGVSTGSTSCRLHETKVPANVAILRLRKLLSSIDFITPQ